MLSHLTGNHHPTSEVITRLWREMHEAAPGISIPAMHMTRNGSVTLLWRYNSNDVTSTFQVEVHHDGEVEWVHERGGKLRFLYVGSWNDPAPARGLSYLKDFV